MSDIHISESVFAQSFLRNLTVSTNVKATFHRHLSCTRGRGTRPQAPLTTMSPHPPAEGADESIVSSSPFLHSRPWYPSSGTSDGHVTSTPRRRCRLKRHFIVTFPALATVVPRHRPVVQSHPLYGVLMKIRQREKTCRPRHKREGPAAQRWEGLVFSTAGFSLRTY